MKSKVVDDSKVKNLLMAEFVNAKARNPHFSMRAFSRRVGIPQSAISEILSGKRQITGKMAGKIVSGLNVSAAQLEVFFGEQDDVRKPYKSVDMSTFAVISD